MCIAKKKQYNHNGYCSNFKFRMPRGSGPSRTSQRSLKKPDSWDLSVGGARAPFIEMHPIVQFEDIMIEAVIAALTRGGSIIIVESEGSSSQSPNSSGTSSKNAFILGLTTTQKLLEHEAEIIRLVKPCRTRHKHIPTIMERFTVQQGLISYLMKDKILLLWALRIMVIMMI